MRFLYALGLVLQVSKQFVLGWKNLMSVIFTVMDNDTVPTATNLKRSIHDSIYQASVQQYLREGGK